MNYFEFYGLRISFYLDKKELRKKYIQISKACHPDFYTADSAVSQEQALQKSSFNNKAYNILKDDRQRIKYVLDITLVEPSKKQVPPDFLMEMMEINEQVMNAIMEDDTSSKEALKLKIQSIDHSLQDQLEIQCRSYDSQKDPSLLLTIQELLLKLQYMDRLLQNSQLFS